MARARKSRLKAKPAPAKPARAKRAAKRPKPRRKAASRKSFAPALDPIDGLIEAAARVLALPVEPQWLPDIKANLAVTLRAAALVADFALPDESEPAPIFMA